MTKLDSIIRSKYEENAQYVSLRSSGSSEKDIYKNNVEFSFNGFLFKGRKNSEVDLIVNKNSYLNILFSNFRSDCSDKAVYFSGSIPVFVEPFYDSGDLSLISSSHILVNGIPSSSMLFLFGNKYEIRFPSSFGSMVIEDGNNGIVSNIKDFNSSFGVVEIYSSKTGDYFFNIKFSNCPLLNIKCKSIYCKEFEYSYNQSSHPLSFYDFEINDNRWSLSCPKNMTIEKSLKTQYNLYYSSGSNECFKVNGFENPIFIFKYDTDYIVKNNEKNSNPFYFDATPDGLFKNPYNDFENDVNTHRDVLHISFSSSQNRNEIYIDPLSIARGHLNFKNSDEYYYDPYYDFGTSVEKSPSYDQDNIFYCSSRSSYFGNKILVGKVGLKEVVGFYGISSPNVKKFYFEKTGDYYINDIFFHSSGRYCKIRCIESDNLISPSKQVAELYGIRDNEFNKFFQEDNSVRVSLIGDLFNNAQELSESSFYESFNSNKRYFGNIVIMIPYEILDFSSPIGMEYLNCFLQISKNNNLPIENIEDNIVIKFNILITKIKSFFYNNMATSVGVEII